jgi:hypothetical protein
MIQPTMISRSSIIGVLMLTAGIIFACRLLRSGQKKEVKAFHVETNETERVVSPKAVYPKSTLIPQTGKDAIPTFQSPPTAKKSQVDELTFPRERDDLREAQFIAKYKNSDINALTMRKPVTTIQGTLGVLFVIGEARVITTLDNGEVQYRRWITQGPTAGSFGLDSCISIQKSGETPIIGSFEDGSLTVRDGPIRNSYLLGLSEKHFFLIYDDVVAWEEIRSNPHISGTLLYYMRTDDGEMVYQGFGSRWIDVGRQKLDALNFCSSSFSDSSK